MAHTMKSDVYVALTGSAVMPKRMTQLEAGWDIFADFEAMIKRWDTILKDSVNISDGYLYINPLGRILMPTGVYIATRKQKTLYNYQIRPKSGKAIKYGLTVLNTPGTIDNPYRGEIRVELVNLSNHHIRIYLDPESKDYLKNRAIAQLVPTFNPTFIEIDFETFKKNFMNTERGVAGFGELTDKKLSQ